MLVNACSQSVRTHPLTIRIIKDHIPLMWSLVCVMRRMLSSHIGNPCGSPSSPMQCINTLACCYQEIKCACWRFPSPHIRTRSKGYRPLVLQSHNWMKYIRTFHLRESTGGTFQERIIGGSYVSGWWFVWSFRSPY